MAPDECAFYVAADGDDLNDGGNRRYPKKTVQCAIDPNCNNGLAPDSVVCVAAGTVQVWDTLRPRASFTTTLLAYEGPGSVTFDAMEQGPILNAGRTPIVLVGFNFVNGRGSSGAALYGEARMELRDCRFEDNESKIDGNVMVSRDGAFANCTFVRNRAKFAAAVRVSDIGSAAFEDCTFVGNVAERRGGAMATQVEDPHKAAVRGERLLFCFNQAPEGPNVYDFRDAGLECTGCQYDDQAACAAWSGPRSASDL